MKRWLPLSALQRSVFLSAAIVTAAAGVPRAANDAPRFTRLSVEDGLSQSSVQQILQDRKGLLWFGTQEGLNRYDGYRFTIHRAREQDGFLGDHDITALSQDARGDLWVGTSRGLYRHDLDTGRFDPVPGPVSALGIRRLVRSGDGRMFFAASDGRLWVLDPAAADRRARVLNDGPFTGLTNVTALATAGGSAIWAASEGRLFKVDPLAPDAGQRLRETLSNLGAVTVMAADPQGNLWLGRADDDLLRYRVADGALDRFPQAPRLPLAILAGRAGGIWIGARRGGLSRLDPATGQILVFRHDPDDATSLLSDDVAALFEDANGSLWIGSWNGGVNRFDPHGQAFRTFRNRPRVPDSLPTDDVTVLTETPDGTLWFGSRSGIVGAGDPWTGQFRVATKVGDGARLTSLASWNERILVGTAAGLTILEPPDGRHAPLDDAWRRHRLESRPVAAMRTDGGVAWVASENELFRVTRAGSDGPVELQRIAAPVAGAISALSTPARERVWIGTDAGEIVRVEWNGAGAITTRPLDLPGTSPRDAIAAHGFVSTLHEDQRGRLWVGTRRGLGRIELGSGKVSWLGTTEGLPSTNISGIAGGEDGGLWIGHNRGLTRIDVMSGAMTHFGERDGAQGTGYAESAWAVGGSGRIYFAGDGITVFDPTRVDANPYKPAVVFTALEVLHRLVRPRWLDPASPLERTIDAQSEITLGPDANVFSVEMAPLHYADPPSNRLMYRLEGFDPRWIETDARNRVATYTNLAPGRYVLRARAGTKNGVWSDEEATLAIRILPPWWRTDKALAGWLALTLVAAGLGWTAVRRRARVRLALLERETLRRDSLTDPLTGLYNRRFLLAFIEREVPRVVREYRVKGAAAGADLLLLLIDVDRFKSINDEYSHGAGDRVLSQIAGVLKDHVRGSDLAVRWGGDEFLVVTRTSQRARAGEFAERLRAAVESLGETLAAEGGPRCTLSIGFAAFPFLPSQPDALSWEQTLELADHALRLTKRRRRNSYTGLRAADGATAASLLEFLSSGGDAPLPPEIEIVAPAVSSAPCD